METEKIINELKTFVATIPSDQNVFVSMTVLPEDEAKAYCNLPSYWVYKTLTSDDKARAVAMYFTRNGLEYKFIQTDTFDHARNVLIYAIPKKIKIKHQKNIFRFLFGKR